jgi:hypothetical protein
VKYITIRLLVDDHQAKRILHGLGNATADTGYIGLNVEHDILDSFKVEDQAELEEEARQSAARLAANRPKRRLKSCVEQWSDCFTGDYDPQCCRFPKSCSASVYREGFPDELLEPAS